MMDSRQKRFLFLRCEEINHIQHHHYISRPPWDALHVSRHDIRPAEPRDLHAIVQLISELAEFEQLTHLLEVTPAKLEAWIDDVPKIEVTLAGKRLSLRPGEIERSLPLGVAAYQTRAAIRGVRLRRL